MSDKKASYILLTVGVTLPGYERKDLKTGKVVVLDEEVGDAYAKKGLLKKGVVVDKTSTDKELDSAISKVKDLTEENDSLKSKFKPLSESHELLLKKNEGLKRINESSAPQLEKYELEVAASNEENSSLEKENKALKAKLSSLEKENKTLVNGKK